ncbi:hypothetical protein M422DRAFT_48500 [Sphaerobolus stellatus SS14]|uniref:Uncharacterized protein n=1 Tax=Sphaerobolus stellatus (strain SS14) TaxID=990650 RepID=A0A0C9UFQ6_SPHS4|nr:hypothetical protein M422DRAFT_48500 [Sphaerobolus stellatus SS14]
MVSGGYWKSNGNWITASSNVCLFFRHNPRLQALLGWVDLATVIPGFVKPPPHKNLQTKSWEQTSGVKAIPLFVAAVPHIGDETKFEDCLYVISQAGDIVKPGHFVIYGDLKTDVRAVGCIAQILQETGCTHSFIVLQKFSIGSQHTNLEMPTLHKDPEHTHILMKPKSMYNMTVQDQAVLHQPKA